MLPLTNIWSESTDLHICNILTWKTNYTKMLDKTIVPQITYPVCTAWNLLVDYTVQRIQWKFSMHCQHIKVGFSCIRIKPDSERDNLQTTVGKVLL